MKLHDFGLWFRSRNAKTKWTNLIPNSMQFDICYDAQLIAAVDNRFKRPYLTIFKFTDQTHIVKLNITYETTENAYFIINKPLTINDFKIIPNPHCHPK
jgi:hypothetical protein